MVPAEVYSGRFLFDELEHAIYKFVANFEPGLILDVGAAAGYYSAFMVQLSPKSKVLAFEPFPGNWPHFEKRVGDKPQHCAPQRGCGGRDWFSEVLRRIDRSGL